MRTQSRKRRGERRLRQATVETVALRDGDGCYAQRALMRHYNAMTQSWPLTCAGPLDAHEVIPRSAWPGGHLVASNVRLVCRRHHQWIDDFPEDAHSVGLHGFSWERP